MSTNALVSGQQIASGGGGRRCAFDRSLTLGRLGAFNALYFALGLVDLALTLFFGFALLGQFTLALFI
jgi:hypothetical protein